MYPVGRIQVDRPDNYPSNSNYPTLEVKQSFNPFHILGKCPRCRYYVVSLMEPLPWEREHKEKPYIFLNKCDCSFWSCWEGTDILHIVFEGCIDKSKEDTR